MTKTKTPFYCLLINRSASGYRSESIDLLTTALRKSGAQYTIMEPSSAAELLRVAERAAGVSGGGETLPPRKGKEVEKGIGSKYTAFISCGGDGTFNLVSRSALQAGIPVGFFPLGKFNNIARFFMGKTDLKAAIDIILAGNYRNTDVGNAGGQPFIGSLGIGFIPSLAEELATGSVPRYSIGWSKLGSRAASTVVLRKTVIKVDSFKFEASPLILNVNLLSYSAGLRLTPASLCDDGQAEVVFDEGDQIGEFSSYTRSLFKEKYLYGSHVKLFRGREITCHPVKGRQLYLDGELLKLPTDSLEIRIGDRQLKVLA